MPDMTADATEGVIARVVHWIANRLSVSDELDSLSHADIAAMAHDIGVTEADLRDVMAHGVDNSQLMQAMLRARGLDPDKVARLSVGLMRDLELTCTRCESIARCRRELAAGTAAARCHEFCGNADTLDAVLEDVATI